jgi:hypothetical protein
MPQSLSTIVGEVRGRAGSRSRVPAPRDRGLGTKQAVESTVVIAGFNLVPVHEIALSSQTKRKEMRKSAGHFVQIRCND